MRLLILPALSGCLLVEKLGDDSGLVACSTEARPSVVVSLVDADGVPVTGAVTVWGDGLGGVFDAECANASCSQVIAGYEVAGTISVYASLEEPSETPGCTWQGYAFDTATVPLTADGCHVETQEMTLVLVADQEFCDEG